jgi:hypothetical protein
MCVLVLKHVLCVQVMIPVQDEFIVPLPPVPVPGFAAGEAATAGGREVVTIAGIQDEIMVRACVCVCRTV